MGTATTIRGDIQGLRAVAVLTVLAAHASLPGLAGGFVGVDVFFVISGYLIAGLLFREIERHGEQSHEQGHEQGHDGPDDGRPYVATFSLTAFWARRARRIVPAASVVIVVTVAVSALWMSLIDTRQTVTDGVWASLFAANIRFAQLDADYFVQDIGTSPLQHFWSLAVEEQFYLVWPLLLTGCLLLAGALRRRRGSSATGLPRTTIAVALGVVTLVSLAWSITHTPSAPESAYFSTFTRAWELGVGALCALVPLAVVRRRLTRPLATALGGVGLAAILLACVTYDEATVFPGYAAALPVLGAAAVLVAGSAAVAPRGSRLLDNSPMRLIGDWSYSLYLWHWPALVLPTYLLERSLTPLETVVAVLVALNLAALSYRFVEAPFRDGRLTDLVRPPRRALAIYPVAVAVVLSACLATYQWTDSRLDEGGDAPAITAEGGADAGDPIALVRASVDAAREGVDVPSDLTPDLLRLRESIADVGDCDYSGDQEGEDVVCPRGADDGSRSVVVLGDSHARAWIPAFEKIAKANNWTAYYLVKSQCSAAHVTLSALGEDAPFAACDEFHDWTIDAVAELDPDLVVVASAPPVNGVFDAEGNRSARLDDVAPLLRAGYDDLFSDLTGVARRVVLLRDVPKSPGDPGACLTQRDPSLGSCMFVPVERSEILGDIGVDAAHAAGVEVVDPTPWLCYQDSCPVVIGGTLSYRDTGHLTTEYAASLSDPLGRALRMVTTD